MEEEFGVYVTGEGVLFDGDIFLPKQFFRALREAKNIGEAADVNLSIALPNGNSMNYVVHLDVD